ncbi:MAG: AsmA-like C-terminal region-containing protein, partial [Desulfopila sp.]|nr:AsmA-like C-terminal region-containing protein [Desulfopila sp.]
DTAGEIKQSLNGSGSLNFFDGALVGIDLAEMGRSLAAGAGYQKPTEKPQTDFAELRVPFAVVNGLFEILDATLFSPLLRVNAAGTADFVTEKLDVKVRPKIVGTLKGQGDSIERSGLAVPIRVEGTFAEPEYSADFRDVASREALEEALKDPEGTKEKVKALEETGKSLLQGFGFGTKK